MLVLISFIYLYENGIGIMINIILNLQLLYGHFHNDNSSDQWTWDSFHLLIHLFLLHIKVDIIEVFHFSNWLFHIILFGGNCKLFYLSDAFISMFIICI